MDIRCFVLSRHAFFLYGLCLLVSRSRTSFCPSLLSSICRRFCFLNVCSFPFCRSHLPPRTSAESPATSRLQRSGPNGTNGSIKSGAFSRRSHGRLLQFRSRRRRRYVLIASSTSAFLEIRWVIWLHAFVS